MPTLTLIASLLLGLNLAAAGAATAATAPAAALERPQDRWDLSAMYATPADFERDAVALAAQLPRLAACQGALGERAGFKACLDLYAEMRKRSSRLNSYANEYFNQDTGERAGNEFRQRAGALANQFGSAASFLRPELVALGAARVNAMLDQDASLAPYRFRLNDMLRAAPHSLDAAGEQLVAQFGQATDAASSIYQTLSTAELPWPGIALADGSQLRLDKSGFGTARELPGRDERKRAFDAYWGMWQRYEGTFGEILYGRLQAHAADARVHHYADTLSAALDDDNVPPAVYRTLIAQTNANLPTLQRYFRLRARLLGVTDLAYYDISPPLVAGAPTFPLAQAKQLVLGAAAPLGSAYTKQLAAALEARWMDVYPRPRKNGGGYMDPGAYQVHPYLLFNYTGNYESLTTLAHEWGHAMHSVLTSQAQAPINAHYSVFVAEIASTTNEALLLEHMLRTARDDDQRLFYLGAALEGLRATYFRQAMFAEFEAAIHARVDGGAALTGAQISAVYLEILKRYHGADQGVMKIDPAYAIEWASVHHFYHAYYVYQYATSIAAAQAFAQRLIDQEPGAREAYLAMLAKGGSAYPYEAVKAAGVDLATPQPYQAVAARMNRIMDQIEAIETRREK